MEIDLTFYIKSLVIVIFVIISLVNLVLIFRSKPGSKKSFAIIASATLFCALSQAISLVDIKSIQNIFGISEAIFIFIIALFTFIFVKKFNK
jgi:hypothetical protein